MSLTFPLSTRRHAPRARPRLCWEEVPEEGAGRGPAAPLGPAVMPGLPAAQGCDRLTKSCFAHMETTSSKGAIKNIKKRRSHRLVEITRSHPFSTSVCVHRARLLLFTHDSLILKIECKSRSDTSRAARRDRRMTRVLHIRVFRGTQTRTPGQHCPLLRGQRSSIQTLSRPGRSVE